ncbi:MAG: flagellar hook-basal body complex protein [Phycisphaerales bacterium]|nr:flagellar hook-basal body complex protein [Phycisphaerales bacterium]MCB9836686.1 flagellar hook-basal body complex protein [Phycisphaera sp.]
MASTSSLFIGLSGLNANSRNIDVIGNNIANVNTNGFKAGRLNFAKALSRTVSEGTSPGSVTGGSNPTQFGQGVTIAGTQRNMSEGAPTGTGDSRDLAIEGNGFFILESAEDQYYTRVGSFRTDRDDFLTSIDGNYVLGYPADENFQIQPGALERISIPVGALTIAEATTSVNMAGNLNASGTVATTGSSHTLDSTTGAGFSLIAGATVPATAPNVLETTSLLGEIEDPISPGSGTPLFTAGQTIRVDGVEKGTQILGAAGFLVDAASTVQDFMDFLTDTFGLRTDIGTNADGGQPGIALDPLTGTIDITGNAGETNNITMTGEDIRVFNADGTLASQPFLVNQSAEASGEAIKTAFSVYDSLGTPLRVDISMVLEGKSNTGTTWRYYAESPDDTLGGPSIGTGTIEFDNFGKIIGPESVAVVLDRDGTGAASPLTFDIRFNSDGDQVTSLTDSESSLVSTFQDGVPIGTLDSYAVGGDGVITGTFSNGLIRTLGQVALASFTVPEGLVELEQNLFRPGPNSGPAIITEPQQLGTGRIVSGALETSNVDLGQEFISLILASTGYSASARVIRTSDELIQQLLVLGQ